MKTAEIRELATEELAERIQTEEANYNIARMKTILHQRELNK